MRISSRVAISNAMAAKLPWPVSCYDEHHTDITKNHRHPPSRQLVYITVMEMVYGSRQAAILLLNWDSVQELNNKILIFFIVGPSMLIVLSPLFVQLMHANYCKNGKELKSFKIIIVAPTCFGLHKPSPGSSQPVLR